MPNPRTRRRGLLDVLEDAGIGTLAESVPSHTGGEKGARALSIAPPALHASEVKAALMKDGERRLKARSTAV